MPTFVENSGSLFSKSPDQGCGGLFQNEETKIDRERPPPPRPGKMAKSFLDKNDASYVTASPRLLMQVLVFEEETVLDRVLAVKNNRYTLPPPE
jgi:hypothetical protein